MLEEAAKQGVSLELIRFRPSCIDAGGETLVRGEQAGRKLALVQGGW